MRRLFGLVLGIVFGGVLLSYGVTQEVQVGGIEGKLVMSENDKPLPKALVTFTPMSELDQEIIRPRYKRTKDDGTFDFHDIPAGAYEMNVSAQHHQFKARFIWINEGKLTNLDTIRLAPVDPYLKLYASQRVFTPDEKPGLELHGFIKADQVQIKVFALNLDYLYKQGGLSSALYPLVSDAKKLNDAGKMVAESVHKVERRDAEGAFIDSVSVPDLKEGFYMVQCVADKQVEATFLNVTSIAMVSKSGGGKALGYVTDIKSGQPVSGATVMAYDAGGLRQAGKTAADGTISTTCKGDSPVMFAKRGSAVALVGFYNDDRNETQTHITSYTDRPIYRPGDDIHFKGIVRVGEGDNMRLPANGSMKVELHDSNGNTVATTNAALNAHGTYDGSFATDSEVDPGDWSIVSTLGKATDNLYVPIASYRKPEYTVTVKSTEPYFIIGGKASVKVKAEYYFGGPVPGAKITASIYRSPIYGFSLGGDEEDANVEYEDSYEGGEYVQDVEATTDANGEATITFDTKAKGDPEDYPTDFTYSVTANVADSGDKYFSGDGSVTVVRGAFDLSVDTENYVVDTNSEVTFKVKTQSHEGKALGGKEVKIQMGMERYTNRSSFFEPGQSQTVTTDANGNATFKVKAEEAGTLKALATVQDDQGNKIASEASTWVSGVGAVWYPSLGSFKLTLDKKSYKPGETATILLQAEKTGGSALVTVESNAVMWQKVVPLTSSSVTVDLPVVKGYAPNVFVTAAYIRDKKFFSAEKQLKIERPDRNLKVSVTPSQQNYQPGDVASMKIKTTDEQGNPASANLSLAVVDESIYALRSDNTDLLQSLYPQNWNQVTTSYSFPEVYLDGGDKGGPDLRLRTKFKDTAYWAPDVNTDANGEANVTFTLPDNLTEWRATAIGVTDTNSAGMSKAQFKARKDLMVRLQSPMYLTQYDEQHMSVVVTNDTGKDQDINVTVASEGVNLDGNGKQTIHVEAGKPQALDFTLKAPSPGIAKLTAKAWIDGGANDGVQQELTIHPFGRKTVASLAGVATPKSDTHLDVLDTAAMTDGELVVNVSPTLTGGLVQTLPGLIDFPYGCVEQTMSRFMPAMVVAHAIGDLKLEVKGHEKLPTIARIGYQRLAKMQNYEGGWGWWEGDEGDPFMTALVLDGVDRAREAGYPAKYIDIKKAVDAAVKLSSKAPKDEWAKKSWDRDRIYLAYVLARYGRKDVAAKILAGYPLKGKGSAEAALAALTAYELGDQQKLSDSFTRLRENCQEGPTTANWAPEAYSWGCEPTALALTAYLTARPSDPVITKAVRQLMLTRKGDMWTSTRDTSYAVVALTKFVEQHPDPSAGKPAKADVMINGVLQQIVVDPQVGATVRVPIAQLKKGQNDVRVVGSTDLYYTVMLSQFDVRKKLDPEPGVGFSIERSYHLLEARTLQNGTTRLMPTERSVDQAKSGDVVRVELKIKSDVPREYMMIEDPMPSNFRNMEGDVDFGSAQDEGWWWSKTVVRDDRIAFFARWLPRGESTISYNMRAESPGIGGCLPTHIENMYDPGQRASWSSTNLEVVR